MKKVKSKGKYKIAAIKTTAASRKVCADHQDLLKIAVLAKNSIKEEPKLGMLFMVNPVLAIKEMGVELTDSMTKHVKKAIRTAKLTEGNKALFKKVKNGKFKIPWVDKVTFRKNKIADEIGR
ncbi:MAG: hypothetical protein LLF28_04570 [Nitrospiraceae bacterium]|nr:hypothetical protein [Nitrospiraceae bacterium]